MTFTFVSAVNDNAVLESSLMRSSDLSSSEQILLQRGFPNAASAYNGALDKAVGDIVVFLHQDIYLPQGWLQALMRSLEYLAKVDPDWGVLGICGFTSKGELHSWVYSSGLGKIIGAPFSSPREVRTLDEVLLVIRRTSGLRFDERLPGFHMYGTDICLEAEKRGLRNYAIPCFAFHNSNGIKNLPWAFWQACRFVRRKWRDRLPVIAPCTVVSYWPWQQVRQMLSRFLQFNLRRQHVGRRLTDPASAYAALAQTERFSSIVPEFAPPVGK